MGFYPQPNQWLCGPFALKFALLILGIVEEEEAIARAAGTDETGTDETELATAARRYGCELLFLRHREPEAARRDLRAYLGRGLPVLLCINEWNHWVTAVREEHGDFVVLDSHDTAVIRILPWGTLGKALAYHDAAGAEPLFDLHPVVPRTTSRSRATLSVDRARYLVSPENREFAQLWGAVVKDLLALAVPREAQITWSVPFGTLLRRQEDVILDQLDYKQGSLTRETARRLLRHLRFAADTYELAIRPEDEGHAQAAVGAILARWAAGEYRVTRTGSGAPGAGAA